MTKPMYCPMSFNNSNERGAWQECTPDCAWAIKTGNRYCCGIVFPSESLYVFNINTRPLEDDAE